MASKKKLPNEVHGVKIISDCGVGYLHDNSKNKVRIAMVECPDCKEHRKVNIYPLINNQQGIYCPKCSNKGERNGGYKHGDNKSRTNTIWTSMKDRCNNPNSKDYGNYGARGISVCDEWYDYIAFKEWANGRLDSKDSSLERKDVDGNYEPSNVMFIPTYLQAYNRRNGMDMHTSIEFAKAVIKHGKPKGYTMFYMNMFPQLKDYQVKQFVLYSKHIEELSKMEIE